MDKKRISESAVATSQVMMPQDVNPSGNVHGGVIMKLIDTAAGVVARRHTRCNAVTASIDRLDFHHSGIRGRSPHLMPILKWPICPISASVSKR